MNKSIRISFLSFIVLACTYARSMQNNEVTRIKIEQALDREIDKKSSHESEPSKTPNTQRSTKVKNLENSLVLPSPHNTINAPTQNNAQSALSTTPFNEEALNEARRKRDRQVRVISQPQPNFFSEIADEIELKRKTEREKAEQEDHKKELKRAHDAFMHNAKKILEAKKQIEPIVKKKLVEKANEGATLKSMDRDLPDRLCTLKDSDLIVRTYFLRELKKEYEKQFTILYTSKELLDIDASRAAEEALQKYYDPSHCCAIQ